MRQTIDKGLVDTLAWQRCDCWVRFNCKPATAAVLSLLARNSHGSSRSTDERKTKTKQILRFRCCWVSSLACTQFPFLRPQHRKTQKQKSFTPATYLPPEEEAAMPILNRWGEGLLRQKRLEHYCSKKRNQNPRWGPIRVIPLYRYVLHTAFASDHYGMPPSQHKRRQPEGRQCVNWTKNGFPRRLYAGSEDKCYTRPTAK